MRRHWSRFATLIVATAAAPVSLAGAQSSELAPKPSILVAGNPLGFLQFGPTAEAEAFVNPTISLATGVRIPTLGLLAHVVDDQIGFAWTVMGSVRFYLDSAA